MNTGSLRWGISYLALMWSLAAVAPEARAAPELKETVLYSFSGGADGAAPNGSLIGINTAGVLYGTTQSGGSGQCGTNGRGCGTVFELVPPANAKGQWTAKTLHTFTGGDDGGAPLGGLLGDKTGALYGTTSVGGGGACYTFTTYYSAIEEGLRWKPTAQIGCGAVFKLTPPAKGKSVWTETVLYAFQGPETRFAGPGIDGVKPQGSLIGISTGELYGVTVEGGGLVNHGCHYWVYGPVYGFSTPQQIGASVYVGCGTAFKLTPPAKGQTVWTETSLYLFPNGGTPGINNPGAGGSSPSSLIGSSSTKGALLGTNAFDGSVFQIASDGTESVLFNFGAAAPAGRLYQDKSGAIFGMTSYGGDKACGGQGCGIIFELVPPGKNQTKWTGKTLHNFAVGHYANHPIGGLISDVTTGTLYGATEYGGYAGCSANQGCGTVFSLTPPPAGKTTWTVTILHHFGGFDDGANPTGDLILDSAGNLYGTTSRGGPHGGGTIFKIQTRLGG